MHGHGHDHTDERQRTIRTAPFGSRRRAAALGGLLALVALPATACSSPAPAPRSKPAATSAPATPAAPAAPQAPKEPKEPKETKVYTPADFCKDKDKDKDKEKLLEPAKRIVLSIANAGDDKGVMGATEPKLNCGPGVDNDGYFETDMPIGPYYLAGDAKVRLLSYNEATKRSELRPADVETLAEVVRTCAAGTSPAQGYTCAGNLFYAKLDEKTGVVTDLTAIFQS
ncbi:hypothetical protein [Streptomyces griseocarneus]|uniref:hypothetical protein n=1 Tax=Streptomyces griseocarneus TaxID=51201 RepID=UPI00167E9A06|nr:hypothetical protein [Streptomyces griseocarneus]MBZ6477957.1 hypothetical protein [Streptomyces griseocarneus]GHG54481.1 hypothetical protein GCM10018779_17500 [Streptomyces griseocarneus]